MQTHALVRLAGVVIRRRVAGNDHHRRPVGCGGGDAGQRVGQAGRQMDVEDGELVRDAEVRVGGVGGLLFVPKRHVLDAELVAGVDQRVVGVSALAEDLRHALLLQAVGHEHRSSHLDRSPHKLIVISRSSVISCIAYFGPSRPNPLSLTPLNGIRSTRLLDDSLMWTTPTWMRRAAVRRGIDVAGKDAGREAEFGRVDLGDGLVQ